MKKESLQKLAHLAAGLITLLHGFEELERNQIINAGGYFVFAIGFLLIAGAHKYLNKKLMQADVPFFLLEAVIIFYSGWHYKTKGQIIPFYTMIAIGVAFVIFGLMSISLDTYTHKRRRKHRKSNRQHKPRTIKTEEFLQTGSRPNAGNRETDLS